jgi:hypothetical protein
MEKDEHIFKQKFQTERENNLPGSLASSRSVMMIFSKGGRLVGFWSLFKHQRSKHQKKKIQKTPKVSESKFKYQHALTNSLNSLGQRSSPGKSSLKDGVNNQ